jgi:hypothetical protein
MIRKENQNSCLMMKSQSVFMVFPRSGLASLLKPDYTAKPVKSQRRNCHTGIVFSDAAAWLCEVRLPRLA